MRHNRSNKVLRLAEDVNWTCPYCFEKMVEQVGYAKTATIDHVHPISKGGLKEAFNEVVCCSECNTTKGNLTLQEFFKKRQSACALGL